MSNYYYAVNHTKRLYVSTGDKAGVAFHHKGSVFGAMVAMLLAPAQDLQRLSIPANLSWAGDDVAVVGDESSQQVIDIACEDYADVTETVRNHMRVA